MMLTRFSGLTDSLAKYRHVVIQNVSSTVQGLHVGIKALTVRCNYVHSMYDTHVRSPLRYV